MLAAARHVEGSVARRRGPAARACRTAPRCGLARMFESPIIAGRARPLIAHDSSPHDSRESFNRDDASPPGLDERRAAVSRVAARWAPCSPSFGERRGDHVDRAHTGSVGRLRTVPARAHGSLARIVAPHNLWRKARADPVGSAWSPECALHGAHGVVLPAIKGATEGSARRRLEALAR
jgi:hypothetical protein